MPSGNFFWCNIKLIVIKSLLIKNNVTWFTIYIVSCKYDYCVCELWWIINYYNDIIILLWRLSSTKWNVSICEIHVNMRWLIVTLWDFKLWTWYLVVNKCVFNTYVTIIMLWAVNYTITRLVLILRKCLCVVLRESVGFLFRNQC